MLKAVAGNIIILGLSRANIDKLVAGDPIRFTGDVLGLPDKVFYITFGETETEILNDIETALKSSTSQ